MCGIVGFTGREQAAPILLDGLSKLEYRGYDSAGIAVRDGENPVDIVKAKGRLKILAEKTNDGKAVVGSCGIGHTRWATHGEPSENNAHPHRSDNGNIVAVHNGIIENYQELKEKLVRKGYTFYSDTDTEVAVKLMKKLFPIYNTLDWCISPMPASNEGKTKMAWQMAEAMSERMNLSFISPTLNCDKPQMKQLTVEDKIAIWRKIYDNNNVVLNSYVRGKNIIVVDDLYQSGATIWEYAKYLKIMGAKQVYGIVCVKSLRDSDNT